MKILIDGDACRVLNTVEKIAKRYSIESHIYCNTTTNLHADCGAVVHIVEKGHDTADFALINNCEENDIVITNDIGLASMVLAKNAKVLTNTGIELNDTNIMLYLNSRYVKQTIRRKQKRLQIKGNLYGELSDAKDFKQQLINMIKIDTEHNNEQ